MRNYTFGDLTVRYQTMLGKGVLSPIGFDSFGLPAENAAIKTGTHPRIFTDARIAELTASLRRLGAVYDWRREIHSHDPAYIKWSQAIFLKFWEAGLAYRALAPVNWCPGCQTVLANEQVLADGTCDRSGDVVIKRDLEQWFFRITQYADELLEALDGLEWPERAKTMQRNWIGRSEGAEFDLPVEGRPDLTVRVFTTRPDTSFGMTYAVMAPEHPLVDELTTADQRDAVDALRTRAAAATDIERMAEGDTAALGKRGAFTGSNVINPFTGTPVPVYVADYVLMGYGTGAIMAVPAEDARDWAFAAQHQLPIVRTVQPPDDWDANGGEAYSGDGVKINSGFLDGLDIVTAKARAIDWLEEKGVGERKVNYRLRDWLVSRQRFWGCPIPAVYCPDHGVVPVPEDQLPIVAPDDVEFLPTGQSPLALARGLPAHHLPRLRRSGPPRDGHHGHLRRLVVVLPALHRPLEHRAAVCPDRGPEIHARRPVHRRDRARHPPPALRPLLHAGAHRRRPGARHRPRAVQALPGAGHDPHGRDQDVQVQGQPHRARALLRHGGRRRPPPVPPLRRTPVRRHGLVGADGAGHRRLRSFLRPALAHLHRRDAGAHRRSDGRRQGDAPSRAPHHRRRDPGPRAVVLQHGGGALHGAAEPRPALRAGHQQTTEAEPQAPARRTARRPEPRPTPTCGTRRSTPCSSFSP